MPHLRKIGENRREGNGCVISEIIFPKQANYQIESENGYLLIISSTTIVKKLCFFLDLTRNF